MNNQTEPTSEIETEVEYLGRAGLNYIENAGTTRLASSPRRRKVWSTFSSRSPTPLACPYSSNW